MMTTLPPSLPRATVVSRSASAAVRQEIIWLAGGQHGLRSADPRTGASVDFRPRLCRAILQFLLYRTTACSLPHSK